MEYVIDKESLKKSTVQEISRYAASAYGDDGSSLYDAFRVTSRDDSVIERYIEDGISAIFVRLFDVATREDSAIEFDVPDFDSSMEGEVEKELEKFVVYKACALWIADKNEKESEKYDKRAIASLDRAHILLKSRKAPKRDQI